MDYLSTSIGLLPRRQAVLPRVQGIRNIPPGNETVSFNGPGIILFPSHRGIIESSGRNWGVKDSGIFIFGSGDRCKVSAVSPEDNSGASVTGIETESHEAVTHYLQMQKAPVLLPYSRNENNLEYWAGLLDRALALFPSPCRIYADIFDIIVFELMNSFPAPVVGDKSDTPDKEIETHGEEEPWGYRKIILEVRRKIVENPGEEIDYERTASEYGLSFTTFRRYWNRIIHSPPNEFLNRTRMNYARRLLATTAKPVREIAEESGYSDQLYFSRRFRHYHGVSPSQFRREAAV